ncbi:Ferredoxin [Phyllobacterium sp. YR620]|uniref:hypothetical protein n=1 Tax=Phyllobacterium sp. YR620 TaxID=1881066 RepID=UPI000891D5C2|nr:hypothetical protein [Phyllobacterium sp. YR620]SDO98615.1 Ferredoxin [Phyllobacterium sp. YR620]
MLDTITAALEPHGLVPRGGFVFGAADDIPVLPDGTRARSVVLVGHFGSSIWQAFTAWRRDNPGVASPLDSWSKQVLNAIASEFGGYSVFPSDRPYLPFQQWAMRAEGLRPSPLGLLIHPQYGLWQAFRGALLFRQSMAFAPLQENGHPCDVCASKPCLSACPVDAFDGETYAVARCRDYLATEPGQTCMEGGCLARLGCPVGRQYAYFGDQQRFHMTAFARS